MGLCLYMSPVFPVFYTEVKAILSFINCLFLSSYNIYRIDIFVLSSWIDSGSIVWDSSVVIKGPVFSSQCCY